MKYFNPCTSLYFVQWKMKIKFVHAGDTKFINSGFTKMTRVKLNQLLSSIFLENATKKTEVTSFFVSNILRNGCI